MSPPVLSKLIVTLSKQQHAARKAGQQGEQQQLRVLLQQCGQEWLVRRGSRADGLQADGAVAAALGAAGLQELAAAAAAAGQETLEGSALAPPAEAAAAAAEASTRPGGQTAGAAASGHQVNDGSREQGVAGSASRSSWLDTFVAAAEVDDSKRP
ncbi:hypothetical protein COO60DRAFT_231931 [Scenedesmus sp. NREL 46B-D3]|nr:hypothetical protein COO60DRAFT_231931 [Scenedesmus sp. NREL 46B-D3]